MHKDKNLICSHFSCHLIRVFLGFFPPDKEAPKEAEEEEKEAKGDASNDAGHNHETDDDTDTDLPKEHSVGGDEVITVTRAAPGEITTRSRAALEEGVGVFVCKKAKG